MERQFRAGNRIQLLADRGLNKAGDILTIDRVEYDVLITKELFDDKENHFISVGSKDVYTIVEDENEIYQIY